MRRFYAPTENFTENKIELDAEQSRHLRSVLRLKESDEIQIFDGAGHEFLCSIKEISKSKTRLDIIREIKPFSPESDLDLTLAAAVTKGDKFEFVLQKAVELGVTKIVPLITHRCDVKLRNTGKKLERWKKIIIESAKQCGRAELMQLTEPFEFENFLEATADGTKILFSERGGEKFSEIKSNKRITAVIGSEGGWEDFELESASKKDFQIITLQGRILRAETAAVSIAAILQNHFGDLN